MKKTNIKIASICIAFILLVGFFLNSKLNSKKYSNDELTFYANILPKGMTINEKTVIDNETWHEVVYENKSGDFLSLDCYITDKNKGFLDEFKAECMGEKSSGSFKINNATAEIYESVLDSHVNSIIWSDDENTYVMCSNLSVHEMEKTANSVIFNTDKVAGFYDKINIVETPNVNLEIDKEAKEKCLSAVENATETVFSDEMKKDKAVKGFTLESLYKSFEFDLSKDLKVEVYNYHYYMKADEDFLLAGGLYRGDDGNIRGGIWLNGQIAVLEKDSEILKTVPIGRQDVFVKPSERTPEEVKEIVMNEVKVPRCILWDNLLGYKVREESRN